MSNIAIFKTNQVPQYLLSVNTPDYSSDPDVIVNPDVSALTAVPVKYWKRSGDNVVEMTNTEKKAVDDKEKADKDAQVDALRIDAAQLAEALINKGLITKAEITSFIKSK